ncbi:allophanate hydrolase [Robbsia sp. Bb-Pol-6]|uniref:Allophanate hydrolase n=1 Tax=Robbsia betulipollinis TaxID=2981849 RepID=A0ABT3ZJ23_9BURK|nr:allophanate hydrolase [Robbsia betulipollinis]MCY0385998.1 allophanate hydrolase [Robbsia betulipollinis]
MHGWTLHDWRAAYANGAQPRDLLRALLASLPENDSSWISLIDEAALDAQLARLDERLAGRAPSVLPLYGVPFAAKDNIDVMGLTTTAGCPAFAYAPSRDATLIQRLSDAGAIVVGKTNLDQFATGLNGTRTPYGVPVNTFDPAYVSGGSSSGSATVVARGLVPFSLGTDTAGSGRVPAGLNNIVGLKPTRGALSGRGVVPACRTLDCVSIFATSMEDAAEVYAIAAGFDAEDGLSRAAPMPVLAARLPERPRLGIPDAPEFFGDALAADAFRQALAALEASGAQLVPLDFAILEQVSALLYDGPWVAERYAAIRQFAESHPDAIDPVVREVIFKARQFSAADAFDGVYRLADLKRQADALLGSVDALVVPTAPTHYTIAAMQAEPILLNSRLGTYTNYVNLLDWSAVSVPASLRPDGLPFGITLIGGTWREGALAHYAARFHAGTGLPRGATGLPLPATDTQSAFEQARLAAEEARATIRVAVVGAHLRGMPLNHELTSRDARFVEETTTAAHYRLFALANTTPPKPGLLRVAPAETGAPIVVELWDVPGTAFGGFVAGVPAPLGIGTLTLADGRQVKGFICEPADLPAATDVTAFGGWRAYITDRAARATAAAAAPGAPKPL